MQLVFQIPVIDANSCLFSGSRAGCGHFAAHSSHARESWLSAPASAQSSSPVATWWHVSWSPEGWISIHSLWDHFCFSTVIHIKINEAAIKTMYSYTMVCFAVESRATGISISSGTQLQYNLALKCHFAAGFFPSFISCNQPHYALCSPTLFLLSCWYCNSELQLFTESQNHRIINIGRDPPKAI